MKSRSNSKSSISILLVDDDKLTLGVFVNLLSKKFPYIGFYTATNGRTGVELFKTNMPDIVITDINMPIMNGVKMADEIRSIKPDAKIIVLTANTGKPSLENAVGEGFTVDHYILKPVNFELLYAVIEQCLGVIAPIH